MLTPLSLSTSLFSLFLLPHRASAVAEAGVTEPVELQGKCHKKEGTAGPFSSITVFQSVLPPVKEAELLCPQPHASTLNLLPVFPINKKLLV